MTINEPAEKEVTALVGTANYAVWKQIHAFMFAHYDNLKLAWHTAGKAGVYECKFRKSSKTICALFAREKGVGFMVIFGKDERALFEKQRADFPPAIQEAYDEARTFHDGKWVMYTAEKKWLPYFEKLIVIKAKPTK